MGCDEPLTAYRGREVDPVSGKRPLVFKREGAFSDVPIKLPCGRCMGCRLEHSRQWAIRCMHEKSLFPRNVFLTVTYDDKNIPYGNTLVRRHPQLFLKRFRDKISPHRFRFYGCGEYGEQSFRPHYHFIIFNWDDDNKKFYKRAKTGENLFTSKLITELWPYGFNVIGEVNFKTCAYVARYVTDKLKGKDAISGYDRVMPDGEVIKLLPQFSMMSRGDGRDDPLYRGGIGSAWFDKYGRHAFQWDSVIMNGKEVRPPRFYDTLYESIDPEHMEELKQVRKERAMASPDNTRARRRVKEDLLRLNLKANAKEL